MREAGKRDERRASGFARAATLASGCAVLLACKHSPPAASEATDAGVAAAALPAAVLFDAGVPAARCKLAGGDASTLRDVGDRRSLVVGEATVTADGFAVGIVHAPATGLEALVARLAGHQVAAEWVVAKQGEIAPDAPPPKPLAAGGALYAAYVARAPRDGGDGRAPGAASRRIVLQRSDALGPIASYPDRADESLAFDAALSADRSRAALAWDDGAPPPGPGALVTGGISVAVVPLAAGTQPLPPRAISAPGADVDVPRLEPRAGGGWWLAWAEHHSEAAVDAGVQAGVAQRIESPAEERAYSWIDLALLGDDGAPVGAPRRITSALGHAASFDLASRANGALDVFVRDETQAREGEGGRILHLVVRPDGSDEPAVTVVPEGVGRGSIDILGASSSGAGAWLTFSDAQDRTFVLPLGPDRAPLAGASVEDALEGGRLVAAGSADGAPGGGRFLGAFPVGDGALFREVNCIP